MLPDAFWKENTLLDSGCLSSLCPHSCADNLLELPWAGKKEGEVDVPYTSRCPLRGVLVNSWVTVTTCSRSVTRALQLASFQGQQITLTHVKACSPLRNRDMDLLEGNGCGLISFVSRSSPYPLCKFPKPLTNE